MTDSSNNDRKTVPVMKGRRNFLAKTGMLIVDGLILIHCRPAIAASETGEKYDWRKHDWAYAVDTLKCIGCGSCMRACRNENNVPATYYRTWVERYRIGEDGETTVDVAMNDSAVFEADKGPGPDGKRPMKSFFVPKICNHCETSVCSQVCPVGATFRSEDGVVLVDSKRCVGCGYCVQACPYGTRFINPETHTADKCTLCYHRITKGLLPACVQACPVKARIFGDLKDPASDISAILRERRYTLLKPELGTNPRCYYIGLDGEVK